jgi:glycosidase
MRKLAVILLLVFISVGLTGCGATPTPVKIYDASAPEVRVAIIIDDLKTRTAQPVPTAVFHGVHATTELRKLRGAPFEGLEAKFNAVHDSEGRLAYLHSQSTAVVALVELQAEFYSALNGQNRWTLHATITVGETGQTPLRARLTLPVVLYPYQQVDAVFEQATGQISRRLGRLIDDYLSGRAARTPKHTTNTVAPAAGVSPKALPPKQRFRGAPGAIYFVLVDRFFNGDPSNDGDADPSDPVAWHGGDLEGVIQKLDHLQALGVETLWLSPIYASRSEPWLGHGAFHGYWVLDPAGFNARLANAETLARLRSAAHARGMKIMLDTVVNHVGYDTPMLKTHPEFFHAPKTIEDWNDPVQLVTHQVHGLPDLAQERPAVAKYLLEQGHAWAQRADAFRLDAVKHVPLSFWARFNGAITRAHPEFMLLGEQFDGDPRRVDHTRRAGGFTHMFDFPLSFALRDVFCKDQPVGRIAAVLAADRLYEDAAGSLVTFIDNHDLPRVRSLCGGDLRKVQHALTAQYALRGTVALNYGTEAGLLGDGEPQNRGDMVFEGADFEALTGHIQGLHAMREAHSVFALGDTQVVELADDLLVLERRHLDETARVYINGGAERPLPSIAGWKRLRPAKGPLEAGGVGVLINQQPTGRAVRADVTISVRTPAKLAAGETLYLVGNLPEIGAWDPKKAVALRRDKTHYTGQFTAPAQLGIACKLVIVGPKGAVRWSNQPNLYARTAPDLVLTPTF